MPTPPLSDKVLQKAVKLLEVHGSMGAAARAAKIPESTFQNRIKEAKRRAVANGDHKISLPELPSGDVPIDTVIKQLTENAARRIEAHEARRWIQIKIETPGPFGIVWMGDPHVDDNGCAWPILREHVNLIQKTPALYCAGMGDYNNNWVGRLSRLWAHQDTSAATAWRLVEWLIEQIGDKLILLVKGNHNLWTGAGDPLDFIKLPATVAGDWRLQIEFCFEGADPIRAVAAHDFPGSSMWNSLHANQREAVMRAAANIYIAGHRHTWGLAQHEDGEGRVYILARARGYKVLDGYAEQSGYAQQRYGHSIVTICNPQESDPVRRVKAFADVAEGAEYLTWLRKRWKG